MEAINIAVQADVYKASAACHTERRKSKKKEGRSGTNSNPSAS